MEDHQKYLLFVLDLLIVFKYPIIQSCVQTDKYLRGKSSEPDEYSEEDTNTSASNQSTQIEFVRMPLISRLQQERETGEGFTPTRTIDGFLFVVASAVTRYSPLALGSNQQSIVLFFSPTDKFIIRGSTYLYHRVMCEASLCYQHESRNSCHQARQV